MKDRKILHGVGVVAQLIALLCLLLVVAASAGLSQEKGKDRDKEKSQSQHQTATANSTNANSATASSEGQSNSQTNETRVPRQAPAAVAPDSFPSAPCRVAVGAGASAPVGGVSFGGSKLDAECDKRETARAFANLGYKEAALKILCTTKAAEKALGSGCSAMKPSVTEDYRPPFPR